MSSEADHDTLPEPESYYEPCIRRIIHGLNSRCEFPEQTRKLYVSCRLIVDDIQLPMRDIEVDVCTEVTERDLVKEGLRPAGMSRAAQRALLAAE